MKTLDTTTVENVLLKAVEEACEIFDIDKPVTLGVSPVEIGISSQILVAIIGRIGDKLGVEIPDDFYPFYDKKSKQQLSMKAAAQKLINVVTNGK